MTVISFALISYIVCCAGIFTVQRHLIYLPSTKIQPDISKHVLIDTLKFNSDKEIINVWHLKRSSEHAIIYFGGNAETVYWNIPLFLNNFPGHSVYLVDYRGYGDSTGSPSESALYQDALNLFDHLTEQHKTLSVIGRSLGSGVATYLASKRAVNKLVLVTPFDSIENIAKQRFPFFPISLLLQDKYDSYGRAHLIKSPTLILMAKNDEIIPNTNTQRLASAFRQDKLTFKTIPNSGHNTISDTHDYSGLLIDFL